jgi:hypothetical protein
MTAALNRLANWRSFFAGWQLGTQPASDGPTRAVRDTIEARLILRAEMTANDRGEGVPAARTRAGP